MDIKLEKKRETSRFFGSKSQFSSIVSVPSGPTVTLAS